MAAGTLELWMYPRDRGTCKGPTCGAPIIWRKTTDERAVPFNVDPDVIERRRSSSGRMVEIVATDDMHHRTCPDVDLFRQDRQAAAAAKKAPAAPALPLE